VKVWCKFGDVIKKCSVSSTPTFVEISAMVSELMTQLDSIKEGFVMAKMENESIAAGLLVANDVHDEAIQSQDMAQTYVTLMMSRCSCCRFCGWFDAED
jgi:hypothetical protein